MHPQERELIATVFDRLAGQAGAPRDPEAESLIHERARALPDPLYALAQAACLQDIALRQAQARIAELERQVAAAHPATSGGFLPAAPANPWGPPPTSVPSTQPGYAPTPNYAQPPANAAPQQQSGWGMPPAGGGFLRGVAGTVLGVAGGTLLAGGISSLFSGSHSGLGGLGGFGGAVAAEPARTVENVTVNNYYGDQSASDDADSNADTGWQDDSGSGDDGGSVDF